MRPCLKREWGGVGGGKGREGRKERQGKIALVILIQRGRDLCLVSVGEKKIRILYKVCTYFFSNYFGVYVKKHIFLLSDDHL